MAVMLGILEFYGRLQVGIWALDDFTLVFLLLKALGLGAVSGFYTVGECVANCSSLSMLVPSAFGLLLFVNFGIPPERTVEPMPHETTEKTAERSVPRF